MEDIDNYLDIIYLWLSTNKIGKNKDKRKSISREIFWAVYDNKITFADLEYMIEFINENAFIFKNGCLWDQISEYFDDNAYNDFFKDIFMITPRGLNTSPNACCGKGELLYRLLRPKSRQPNKGDVIDDGKRIEIKGSEIRISSKTIIGTKYREITTNIFEPFIMGNKIKTGGLKNKLAYEIEKFKYRQHYESEFKKLNSHCRIKLMHKLLKKLGINDGCCDKICKDGFDQKAYQYTLLKSWFNDYKKEFDYMIIFGNGSNIKIVNDIDCLTITKDYFRINQTYSIGWYVE